MDNQQDHYSFLIPEATIAAMNFKIARALESILGQYAGVEVFRSAESYSREVRGPRGIVNKIEYAYRTFVLMGDNWPATGMIGFFWDAELNVDIHAVEDFPPTVKFAVPTAVKVNYLEDEFTTLAPAINYIQYNILWRLENVGIYIRQY